MGNIIQTCKSKKITIWSFFWPGYIHPCIRPLWILIFLSITVVQTYCALLLEEQLADEFAKKFPGEKPPDLI